LHNRVASVAALRELFAFGPECRSPSLRNQRSPSSESSREFQKPQDRVAGQPSDAVSRAQAISFDDQLKRQERLRIVNLLVTDSAELLSVAEGLPALGTPIAL